MAGYEPTPAEEMDTVSFTGYGGTNGPPVDQRDIEKLARAMTFLTHDAQSAMAVKHRIEEEAGGYYGCTAGQFVHVILPNSKLDLRFGLRTYYQAVSGYKYPDRGVIPDYPVTHTLSDLRCGRDRDMELALSLARAE
jgi:hypothetical protein